MNPRDLEVSQQVHPPTVHLSLDVGADGPAPGLHSMWALGIRVVGTNPYDYDDPKTFFYAEMKPISGTSIQQALDTCGKTRSDLMVMAHPRTEMERFRSWLKSVSADRPVWWSDNPAFDWQFLNYYVQLFAPTRQLGWSCRRIGDLYAGYVRNSRDTKGWKKWRITQHTHNALDDASGNAEAIYSLMKRMKSEKVEEQV